MSTSTTIGRKTKLAAAVALAAGGMGIFWLPWFVPVRERVTSWSYNYGFNNLTADLAFAGLLLALFLIFLQWRKLEDGGVTEAGISRLLFGGEEGSGAKNLWVVFVIITTLAVAFLIALYRMVPYADYTEYGFFASRLDLMVLGQKPFQDFQFNYGPAMLYPTYWLYELFGGGLSIDAAYAVTLVVHWVAGLYLLYYVVGNLRGRLNKALIFVCVFFSTFTISLGLQYTPLRYACLPAALFCIHRLFSRRKDDGAGAFAKVAGLAFLLPLLILSLSPEIGIACTAGVAVYFAAMTRTAAHRWRFVALAPCVALLVAVTGFSRDYLEGILSRTTGGDTFPVFPTMYVLLLTGAACWILPQLGIIGVCERNTKGSLAMAFAVAFGLLIPACLTHCDNGHVYQNELGLFILFPALALQLENKRASRGLVLLYIIICPVIGTFGCWKFYLPFVQEAWKARHDLTKLEEEGLFDPVRNEEAWRMATGTTNGLVYGKLLPLQEGLKGLLRYPKIGIPLGCDERIERFVKLSGHFSPEYYSGLNMQVFTEAAIERKLSDVRRMDILLVPKIFFASHDSFKESDYVEYDVKLLRSLLMFPVSLKSRHPRLNPVMEITADIMANYGVVGEFRDNWILKKQRVKD